jgi:ubiquinone/menaquinone biosynthesis C-methylase UbiE
LSKIPDFYKALYENRKDERWIEYQFVWQQLMPPNPKWNKVLDVGCCESGLSTALTNLGYCVTGLDIRDYEQLHKKKPIFKFIQGDIRYVELPENFFDQILCVSTVEHIGIRAYGNLEMSPNGDVEAMFAMKRVLKPRGNMILTVPFGYHKNDYWIRFYKPPTLKKLLAGFKVLSIQFYKTELGNNFGVWKPCSEDRASYMDITPAGTPLAVALAILTKE